MAVLVEMLENSTDVLVQLVSKELVVSKVNFDLNMDFQSFPGN